MGSALLNTYANANLVALANAI